MKINKIIFTAIISLFLLTSCNLPAKKQTKQPTSQKEEQKQGFSLKNALSLGKSIKCVYKMNDEESTIWIKGKKMRMEGGGLEEGGKGGMINDGEWIYIWNDKDKKGMKYKISSLNELGEQTKQISQWKDVDKWAMETEEKYKASCHPVVISDSKFSLPDGIEFQDLTAMFEKVQKMKKALPSAYPGKPLHP